MNYRTGHPWHLVPEAQQKFDPDNTCEYLCVDFIREETDLPTIAQNLEQLMFPDISTVLYIKLGKYFGFHQKFRIYPCDRGLKILTVILPIGPHWDKR